LSDQRDSFEELGLNLQNSKEKPPDGLLNEEEANLALSSILISTAQNKEKLIRPKDD
jgi:hypothetical protein